MPNITPLIHKNNQELCGKLRDEKIRLKPTTYLYEKYLGKSKDKPKEMIFKPCTDLKE
jgi:hypothetical protein